MAPKLSSKASAKSKANAKAKANAKSHFTRRSGAEPTQRCIEESCPENNTDLTLSRHVAPSTAESLKSKFQKLDVDEDGQLSFDELSELLQKGNPEMTHQEIRTLFDMVDADKSGGVSINEFIDYIFSPVCAGAMPHESSTSVNPCSIERVAALQKEFPFHCYIELTEHRAITVSQLERVAAYADASCRDWIDTSPSEVSWTSGQTISMEWANLYHINAWIIKPATMRADCAFVELLTCGPQKATWFISHWWGEPLCRFLQCVQNHCKLRDLTFDAPYWVCAYANRQHALQEDISMDPKSTSFYKALMFAVGVLLILDDKTAHSGPATAFNRIWCLSEQAVALDETSKILDIAAHQRDAPQLLTDGIVSVDSKYGEGRALSRKAQRESEFPVEVMKAGFHVQIENGSASVQEDRVHILNSICKRPLDATPVREHDQYIRVNARLSALFAVAAFPRAAHDNLVDELQLLDKIKADRWRTHLSIDAWGWQGLQDTQALTSAAIRGRSNLIYFQLQMTSCSNLACVHHLGHGMVDLLSLRTLTLEMNGCDSLKSVRSFAVGIVGLKALEHLTLNLNRCFQVDDAAELFPSLFHLPALKTLQVRVGFTKIERVGFFAGGGATGCSRLTQLTLFCGFCQELESIDGIGEGLKSLVVLNKFSLNLGKCPSLAGVVELGRGIACLHLLEELELDISSTQISDTTELGRGLKNLTSLRILKLDLRECPCVTIDEIGTSIASLVMLQDFFLDLTGCSELVSINELGGALPSLACLSSLSLRLGGCQSLASIVELGIGCTRLPALKTFNLNANGCSMLPSTIAKAWVEQDGFSAAAKQEMTHGD